MSALTATVEKLRSISSRLEDVVAVLQVVESATGIGGSAAATGLAIVRSALHALEESSSGAMTHEELMMQLDQAHALLAAARADEDAELDALPEAP